MKPLVGLVAVGLVAAASICGTALTAQAQTVSTLSATYDGVFKDTVFTITNTSPVTETDVTISTSLPGTFSPRSVHVGDLPPRSSVVVYDFDNDNGGLMVDPADALVPDTSTYHYSVHLNGDVLVSESFSPTSNLTGRYVDFLGNTCLGLPAGCAVAASGIVANITFPAHDTFSFLKGDLP